MTLEMEARSFKLPPVLDLQAAVELSRQLQQGLRAEAEVVLDASAVELLTVPCIQILMAAANQGNLRVVGPSAEFLDAFRDLSLQMPFAIETPLAPPQAGVPDLVETSPSGSDIAPAKRVLTIDDSKTMRDMLKLTLVGAGYQVIQGVDGQDGLDALGDEMVDVVITDINMPRMDGYQVVRELRKKPHLDHVPILVLTTESETDKRTIAREAGATGWMVKPFDPERLLATVAKVLIPKSDIANGAVQ